MPAPEIGLLSQLWSMKGRLVRLPGAYQAYQVVTKRFGEGQVYPIRIGPMRGFKWRRYNSLPYWYHLGLWEPEVSRLIASHLRPGDCFWDIGANAGYHTLIGSRSVGPTGTVLAIEADPNVARMCREELELNHVSNVELVNLAVADADEPVTLLVRENNLLNSLASVGGEGTPVEVPGFRLDTLLARHRRPHLIKMDIEGAERTALHHGEALFSGPDRPRILLSTHGEDIKDICERFLLDHDYVVEGGPGFEHMLVGIPR